MENVYVILCLYVNYMFIVGSNDKIIKSTKTILNSRFGIEDMVHMDLTDVILELKFQECQMGSF